MKRLQCIGQPYPATTVVKCNFESPRHGPQVVNIVVNIEQPFSKVYVSTNVYVKNRQSLTFVYGTTFEYCEFLMRNGSRQTNPVAVLVYNYSKHNFPQILSPCPILGCYNVSGLPVDENLIPPFVTPGGYFAAQRFHNKRNETLLQYETEFSILLKKFQCTGHPYEISKLHYCQMETLRNGTQVVGVIIEVLNTLQKVNVVTGMYIQYFRTRTPLLATTMEYCQQNKDIMLIKNPTNKFALDYAQQHLPQLLIDCPIRTDEHSHVSTLMQSRLLTRRNEPQVVDVLLDILEPTSKLLVIFNLYTQYFQTKNLLYGTTFEYCDLMKNLHTQTNPVTGIAINVARENFPQVLKQCPLYGLVNVTGLAVDSKLIPPYAPPGAYYFNIRASNKRNETIVACTSEFHIVKQALFTRTFSMLGRE
uniref:Uncharacterized protein n=1 Tax=Anopheles christyi TaxID=43041 RepID=A0A182K4L7_9DIPT